MVGLQALPVPPEREGMSNPGDERESPGSALPRQLENLGTRTEASGCWGVGGHSSPHPQPSRMRPLILCPTLGLQAPALGGGQTPQSHGRVPGKLRGQQGPGPGLVGRGQPEGEFPYPRVTLELATSLGRVVIPHLFRRAHSLQGAHRPQGLHPLWERAGGHTHTRSHARTGQGKRDTGPGTQTHARLRT